MTNDTQTPASETVKGPMGRNEFAARLAELSTRYGANVALKMARRERKTRHPLHKSAVARRVEMADVAIKTTGEFHSL